MAADQKPDKVVDEDGESPFEFNYDEFSKWYRSLTVSCLEPARQTFLRLLNQKLDDELSEFDRHRIRVTASRVKGPGRTWQKLKKDKYKGLVADLESVPTTLDDLVGIRITCHNLVDITHLQSILSDLPTNDAEEGVLSAFSIEPDSEKQYYSSPKPSGYRAYHINLVTLIPQISSTVVHVRGELQVRTLLQDGWGELTHEDTYKPGFPVPELVRTLSRRMADLLATVDDLAQDLREELDRLAVESVGSDDPVPTDPQVAAPTDHQHLGSSPAGHVAELTNDLRRLQFLAPPRQALLDETRKAVASLQRPATLASLAGQIQSIFGTGIVPDWGGYGSFKGLLIAAVPDVNVVGIGPGMVIPPGSRIPPVNEVSDLNIDPDVPEVVRTLRRFDKNAPAIAGDALEHLLQAITLALSEETWRTLGVKRSDLGIRELNLLSRFARDEAMTRFGEHVSRQHLDYVLKSLLWSGNLRCELPLDDVRDLLANWLFVRASKFGLVNDAVEDPRTIRKWLQAP